MALGIRVLRGSLQLTRLQLPVATCPLNRSLDALRQDINTCRAQKQGLIHVLPTNVQLNQLAAQTQTPAKPMTSGLWSKQ